MRVLTALVPVGAAASAISGGAEAGARPRAVGTPLVQETFTGVVADPDFVALARLV